MKVNKGLVKNPPILEDVKEIRNKKRHSWNWGRKKSSYPSLKG